MLDELDRELERRGHRFVRYADDCNVYVRSEQAGLRVMASLTRFIERRLKLQVNAQKSAVARPWQRSFLVCRAEECRAAGYTIAAPGSRPIGWRANSIGEPAEGCPVGARDRDPTGTPQAGALKGVDLQLTPRVRSLLEDMQAEWRQLDCRIEQFDEEFAAQAKTDDVHKSRLSQTDGV